MVRCYQDSTLTLSATIVSQLLPMKINGFLADPVFSQDFHNRRSKYPNNGSICLPATACTTWSFINSNSTEEAHVASVAALLQALQTSLVLAEENAIESCAAACHVQNWFNLIYRPT